MKRTAILTLTLVLALGVCPKITLAQTQSAFKQACSQPNYPSATPAAIDTTSCGVAGNGGAEAAQNTAKNNFCAPGPAKPTTIEELSSLQEKVQQNKNIPFGNHDTHPLTSSAGPAINRAPLESLGEGTQVVLTGFVRTARQEGGESVNCGKNVPNLPKYHDIHISIVSDPNKDECSGVVVEMIPHHRPSSWDTLRVNQVARAKLPVRVTGQLLFDSSHSPCINGKPVGTGNAHDPARISLWEVHPVYKFEVCTIGNCSNGTGWKALEQWQQPVQPKKTKVQPKKTKKNA